MLSAIQNFDISVLRSIQENIASPALDFIMPLITLIGEKGLFWIVLSVALLCFKRTRKTGFVMGLSLLIGLVIVNMTIKPLVARPRPYTVDTDVKLLIGKLSDGSFPSGHTLACFEGAVALLLCGWKKWGSTALVFAFAVAFSRLYLYVHYPTDVLTSMVLGPLFAFVAYKVIGALCKKLSKFEKFVKN